MATPVPMVDGQRYKDKVTIVTGGARGIGEGIAKLFGWIDSDDGLLVLVTASAAVAMIAICQIIYDRFKRVKHGSKVVIVDKREKPSWIDEVNAQGPGSAYFYQCDLTKDAEVEAMVGHVVEQYSQLDCLVNNAGWHPAHKPIDDFTSDDLHSLMDINFTSQFLTCKFSLPHLRKTQGNVINMSSITQLVGQLYAVTYVATKGAISGFTRALAVDEAKYHVRVNSITPSSVWTPLWMETRTSGDDEESKELQKTAAEAQLLGKLGTPEDIGLACLYLAADATFVTGSDLLVTGGAELDVSYKSRLESDEILRWVSLKNKK